jgi:hypothetical protein
VVWAFTTKCCCALCCCCCCCCAGLDPYLESHSSQPPQVVHDLIQASLDHDWKAIHAQVGASKAFLCEAGQTAQFRAWWASATVQ